MSDQDESTLIFCRYGIFSNRFPIAGMSLREARDAIKALLNIPDDAVACVDGEVVRDDFIIGPETELVQFIRLGGVMKH